jgi:hypothetical protein
MMEFIPFTLNFVPMTNPELSLAREFVENTDRHVFLTGKAGTGKTSFLKKLQLDSPKRMVVVAPTGVAAINAKGVTIHSFFQLPFGPIPPDTDLGQLSKRKMRSNKINIIRTLDLLIIDEISMVRADLLDGIDAVLRRYRDKSKVFGGTQVLMIGDIHQLAPVARQEEWQLLAPHYETPFFFSSKVYRQADPVTIELKHIYRQEDKVFIDILDQVRNNSLTDETLEMLNARWKPGFSPDPEEGYITLTTHNNQAEDINSNELLKLRGKQQIYTARIRDNFPEYAYPTFEKLLLKTGAQVMFIKNDTSEAKLYYNGKIGKVVKLNSESISVLCKGESEPIEVKKEIWENVSYTINAANQQIETEVIGTFEQIPLKLAWAITIHKSQGLTFEKAVIDSQAAFAHGQTYVALSRCKTLEGLVLKSRISRHAVITDSRATGFSAGVQANLPDKQTLLSSEKSYQLKLITDLFDFQPLIVPLSYAINIGYRNSSSLKGNFLEILSSIKNSIEDHLLRVSANFEKQLQKSMNTGEMPESDPFIQERFQKAAVYYLDFVNKNIKQAFDSIIYTTDNKEVKKDLSKQMGRISDMLKEKIACLEGLKTGFNVHNLLDLRAKTTLGIKEKTEPKISFQNVTNHPVLFNRLRALRSEIAEEEEIDHFQVFPQAALYDICEMLPTSYTQLKSVHGIGKVRMKLYGSRILEIVNIYCLENDLPVENPDQIPVEKPKPMKGETFQVTLDLFKSGLKPEEIATQRGLVLSTIESHLAGFVLTGELKLEEVLDATKIEFLANLMKKQSFANLSGLKQKAGDDYSFGMLRFFVNHLKYTTGKDPFVQTKI